MDRESFLNGEDGSAFVGWLAANLPTIRVHMKLLPSRFVKREFDEVLTGIEAVRDNYQWNGDWPTVSAELNEYRTDLKNAVNAEDTTATYLACVQILDWGNVPSSREFLQKLEGAGELVTYLRKIQPLLTPTGTQRLSDLTPTSIPKFNSGMTKIHALLDEAGSPIYDGRVGAAIAALYHQYRNSQHARGEEQHGLFAWGPGMDRGDTDRVRQIRNPKQLGQGFVGTSQLSSGRSRHLWARRQVVLGWIMRATLERSALFGGDEVPMAERCHSFEAGLFMMGYDLRALVPGGWGIVDPTKKVYRRKAG